MKAIQEIKKQLAEVQEKMQKAGKAALKEAFTEFFEANPSVTALRWTQYTPYFNDGDVCEFGTGGVYMQFNNAEEGGEEGDGFEYPSTTRWNNETQKSEPIKDKDFVKAAKAVKEFWGAVVVDDIFETAFGDHVQVTATPKGFEVEEYEHD